VALAACVPNFSEGRDPAVVEAIAAAIGAQGVEVLDVHRDPDHHRCVVTFMGPPERLPDAALAGARVAVPRIDLTRHHGVHPRIGAIDVVPFVPLPGLGMERCVGMARSFGEALWKVLGVPAYFYEHAALRPERRGLEEVRRGQFEALREAAPHDPARAPDVGGPALHPTAGATAVGARGPLVAFNVNLTTADAGVAQRVARAVRASSGGLACVKALGVVLPSKGRAQVTMNLTDTTITPLDEAFAAVRDAAGREGASVHSTELVGLVHEAVLRNVDLRAMRLQGFDPARHVWERRLQGRRDP